MIAAAKDLMNIVVCRLGLGTLGGDDVFCVTLLVTLIEEVVFCITEVVL